MPGAGQVKPCYNAETAAECNGGVDSKVYRFGREQAADKSSGRDKQESDTALARRITHGFAE
jgi:hypothetical protein